jgi:ornithine--oxo-acid transaminase
MDVFTPGDHGSTFGGNPLAAAVGSAALELLMQDDLCAHAEAMGERLMAGLRDIDTPLISEVRGRGLLIGVEIEPRLATARMACEVLLEHGILSKDTHHTVLRFAPPLIITSSQIDEALVAIRRALLQVERSIGLKTTRISDEALAA